jgi:hypothetical protein
MLQHLLFTSTIHSLPVASCRGGSVTGGARRASLEEPGDLLECKHAEISGLRLDRWLQLRR